MAYVECVRRGLTAFTVAYWSSPDHCGRCGAELPHPSRGITPISSHPRFLTDLGGPRRDSAMTPKCAVARHERRTDARSKGEASG